MMADYQTLQPAPTCKSIEIDREGRYSQIAMPWDADQMLFRRQQSNEQGNYFTPWVEVVHRGNISAFATPIQTALDLKAPLASPAFTGSISTTGDITCSNDTATTITANK